MLAESCEFNQMEGRCLGFRRAASVLKSLTWSVRCLEATLSLPCLGDHAKTVMDVRPWGGEDLNLKTLSCWTFIRNCMQSSKKPSFVCWTKIIAGTYAEVFDNADGAKFGKSQHLHFWTRKERKWWIMQCWWRCITSISVQLSGLWLFFVRLSGLSLP